MNNDSNLYKYLNKDKITDVDVSGYLDKSQSSWDALKKIRHVSLNDPQYYEDIATIEELRTKEHDISVKLQNRATLTKEEAQSLLRKLNSLLSLLHVTKEENIKEGLEKYINQLKTKLDTLD